MSWLPGDRVPAAVLYAVAVVLLALGGVWWVRAAPSPARIDPELAAWRATVEELLPGRDDELQADTVILDGEEQESFIVDVQPGPHLLSVVCAGRGQVQVDVTTSGSPGEGRPLSCLESPRPFTVPIGLSDTFQMEVFSSAGDRAVLRWQLVRGPA